MIMNFFEFTDKSKSLIHNGHKELGNDKGIRTALTPKEKTEFRGLAARLNFMSLDSPDLQFVIKNCCRDMNNPDSESYVGLKKIARYLVKRESVVWKYDYQDEPQYAELFTDSDWGEMVKTGNQLQGESG